MMWPTILVLLTLAVQALATEDTGGEWYCKRMMTSPNGSISALLALCEGNPPINGGFPSQRPVTRSFNHSFICAWTNGWANNRDAGDLRRQDAHCDLIVMRHTKWWSFTSSGIFKNCHFINIHRHTQQKVFHFTYLYTTFVVNSDHVYIKGLRLGFDWKLTTWVAKRKLLTLREARETLFSENANMPSSYMIMYHPICICLLLDTKVSFLR